MVLHKYRGTDPGSKDGDHPPPIKRLWQEYLLAVDKILANNAKKHQNVQTCM